MNESPRHGLDEAIDRVAAKMVAVDADAGVLHRVLAQLPERTATPWFLRLPVQATAAAAIVAVALVYPRPWRELEPLESATESAPLALEKPAEVRPEAPVGGPELTAVRRLPTPDSRLPAAAPDRPDHEFGLAPVTAIEALELAEIAAPAITLDEPATLEPLILTDLALDPKGDR